MQQRGAGASVAVVVILFAGYALLLGRGAAWLDGSSLRGLTASQRASEIDTMRGYLIQVGAGVLAAGALLYTALNFRLAREGHVTDRYTKAIEQLGSERLDVRLGAIYALERIMIDSSRDHPTIVEVLAAFIREHAPAPDGRRQPEQHRSPATDVQAAVTVLGRRPAGRRERGRVNLTRVDLRGANLTGADLTGADLSSANLTGAFLFRSDLSAAIFDGANLTGAVLNDAHLTGTVLSSANLTGAFFDRANLTDAVLADANLTGANLYRANLTGVNFNRANLTGVSLDGVDLTDAQRKLVQGLSADAS